MTEIPEPEETGSTGAQQSEPNKAPPAQPESPFELPPMVEVMQGLASGKHRSLGGEAPALMAAASFTEMSKDRAEAKAEARTLRVDLDSTQRELSQCRTREAVLNERVSTSSHERHLRNIAIVIGTSLLGVGVTLYSAGTEFLGLLLGGMGLLLVAGGWFMPTSRSNQ